MAVYLHATVSPNPGKLAELADAIGLVVPTMERTRGWQLLGGYQTRNGLPGRIVDIWTAPDADSFTDGLARTPTDPRADEAIDRFSKLIDHEQLRLVQPLDYAPTLPTRTSTGRYLHSSLTVRFGCIGYVTSQMGTIRRGLEEICSWRLIGAYQTLIGDLGELFHLWELPAEGDVATAITRARTSAAWAEAVDEAARWLKEYEPLELERTHFCPSA
jgi:hypothetical protein